MSSKQYIKPKATIDEKERGFLDDLRDIVCGARSKAYSAINYALVVRNWYIGRRVIEQEQQGNAKAEYGKHIIELASQRLSDEFGKGFSVTNIKNFRSFYLKFSDLQINKMPPDLSSPKSQALPDLLPWTHYERLIRISDSEVRAWYAREAYTHPLFGNGCRRGPILYFGQERPDVRR